ncbi:hypothetical protein OMP43_03040 [Sphingomonas sp. CBMAI 2297]|uniref:hypothetical protein n=1 Tax=Sphingomonas sp. CBMAI 2297 TaxID=2991720 RepID=UPI00245856A1|nr:hypothetical protein [Sphingomonas sp. CBMAI 2297]MDH4742989.1 hypothetical protein [Sphingomonas sp. CBMAI 2297]
MTSAVLGTRSPAEQDVQVKRPSRIGITLLAFFLTIASLQQFPQMGENSWIRPLVSVCEAATFCVLLWLTPKVPGLVRWTSYAAALVLVRFLYGWLIANLQYETDILGALQEARFGFFIVGAPAAYVFLRTASIETIDRLVRTYIVFMLLLDAYVTVAYVGSGALKLADRSFDRFVLSIVGPLVAMWVKGLVLQRQGREPGFADYAVLGVFMLHIGLLTTSRSETVLLGSILAQWIYARVPILRWPLVGAMVIVVYFVVGSIFQQGQQVAGRDYALAVHYAQEAFPFGVGFVPEAAQKAQLGRASNFFTSDYGPLVLIYRYGALGVVVAFGLIVFWLRFALKALYLPGTILVAFATLVYLAIVPVLDYGSLNGGIMLGAMAAVASVASSSRKAARRQMATSSPTQPS